MTKKRWVINASPLIVLGNVTHLSLFEALCAEIVIPEAVAAEVHAGPKKDAAQRWLEGDGQTFVRRLENIDPLILAWDLGAGESAVLAWARQNPGYEAILDDRAARNCAVTLRIPVRGTLGVVLLAKREGLIPRVQPVFQELLDAGLRIVPEILEVALKLAGED